MDASDFLGEKGIDVTKTVMYHFTKGRLDGEIIDIEALMEEYKQELLNERGKAERLNENAALPLHDVTASLDAKHLKDKGYVQFGNWWFKDGINVNLMTGAINASNNKCLNFQFTHDTKLTKEKFEEVEAMIQSLLNWR
jgi:hypothetical protein